VPCPAFADASVQTESPLKELRNSGSGGLRDVDHLMRRRLPGMWWKPLSFVGQHDLEAACGYSGASHGDDDLAAATVALHQIPDGLGDLP